MRYLLAFSISLGLTLAIELPLALLFGVRKKGLLVVALVNCVTNPAAVLFLWFVSIYLPGGWYYPAEITIEIVVVLTEWLVYRAFRPEIPSIKRPFLMALVLNACSYGGGLLLRFTGVI